MSSLGSLPQDKMLGGSMHNDYLRGIIFLTSVMFPLLIMSAV
jgi:hypothetical protein